MAVVSLDRDNVTSITPLEGGCFIPFDPAARNIPFGGKMKVTLAVFWIDVALFVMIVILNKGFETMSINVMLGPTAHTLIRGGAMTRYLVTKEKEAWRLLWSIFLHAGVFHIVVNLTAILALGRLIEPDWGTRRFLFVFLISGLTGNMTSCALDDNVVSVGSSGAIYGVLGALLVYIFEFWDSIPLAQTIFTATASCCIFAVITSFIPHIDIYAHIGGFFSGLLAALATCTRIGWRVHNADGTTDVRDPFGYPASRTSFRHTYDLDEVHQKPTKGTWTLRALCLLILVRMKSGYSVKPYINQDRAFILEIGPRFTAFGVFDGHGSNGHDVADFVSTAFKKGIQETFQYQKKLTGSNILQFIHGLFAHADYELGRSGIDIMHSGCTGSLAIRYNEMIYVGYVGDSKVAAVHFHGKKPCNLPPKFLSSPPLPLLIFSPPYLLTAFSSLPWF
ncbi:putative transmembrane protein [Gregarina niphandrodes]|uniref:Rhomboid-like protease n=1 Tax=Gregarina niphandrodes TaxID=110365 RepID=A0A023B0P3_GRENI|nr:putative transmembrane protein [Gregarina niphandrodes]EZG45596.1 putative transmembrane protein [Gregarina niphandrodes]|eukprot:XP_011132472.1 putative transmembrane protein [Gregarina niphandrodes]